MSYELLAKLLSFMTNIVSGTRVIGAHTHRTKPRMIEKTPLKHKSVKFTLLRGKERIKHGLWLETLI